MSESPMNNETSHNTMYDLWHRSRDPSSFFSFLSFPVLTMGQHAVHAAHCLSTEVQFMQVWIRYISNTWEAGVKGASHLSEAAFWQWMLSLGVYRVVTSFLFLSPVTC